MPPSASADKHSWVKEEFERIATGGLLGDPVGKEALAYLRVSSAGQAEEGRSGFPRQLMHVSEKARELGLAIPWHLVFFDDHTGFEFRGRPDLTRLRTLVRQQMRPADDLVIENLDRLSRDSTWHQGFLLDELEKECGVRVWFWKEPGSKLERVVYGVISEDRMRTDLERMANGNIIKARSGRVTAKTPTYGYRFVNAQGGQEGVTKDTYYDFSEPEAGVMRRVYDWLVRERMALSPICRRLIDLGVKPPKSAKAWEPSLLRTMIKNTVYKGEFYAHRYIYIKKVSTRTGKEATHKVERPREEWIRVEVPALVSVEVWDEAQRILGDNKAKSLRNAKREYLLLGLTYCADCKTQKMTGGFTTSRKMTRQGLREHEQRCYICNTRNRVKYLQAPYGHACTMPQITIRRLDRLVWNVVVGVLLNRTQLEQGIEKYFSSQSIETTREEIGYLQVQLTELDLEDGMLYEAYKAKAFDAEEFASKRHTLKERKQRLEEQKAELEKRFSHQASRDERKRQILDSIDELHRQANEETPFDLKRRILLKVIDRIIVNTREEWFELEGAIVGRFDFTSAGRGSGRQRA